MGKNQQKMYRVYRNCTRLRKSVQIIYYLCIFLAVDDLVQTVVYVVGNMSQQTSVIKDVEVVVVVTENEGGTVTSSITGQTGGGRQLVLTRLSTGKANMIFSFIYDPLPAPRVKPLHVVNQSLAKPQYIIVIFQEHNLTD